MGAQKGAARYENIEITFDVSNFVFCLNRRGVQTLGTYVAVDADDGVDAGNFGGVVLVQNRGVRLRVKPQDEEKTPEQAPIRRAVALSWRYGTEYVLRIWKEAGIDSRIAPPLVEILPQQD